MISNYIENTIIKRVNIIETVYSNPQITISELATKLGLTYGFVKQTLFELEHDPKLQLKNKNGHYRLESHLEMVKYRSLLYQQSAFLNYLYFVLTNTNDKLSVVNVGFILSRSTSALYVTRKLVIQALGEFNLKLKNNIVTGNEVAKRLLIATLNVKYDFESSDLFKPSQYSAKTNRKTLLPLIKKYLPLNNLDSYKLYFYQTLILVGLDRLQFSPTSASLKFVPNFRDTDLAHAVANIIGKYQHTLQTSKSITSENLDYFIYVTLIAAPIKINDDLYQVIAAIPEYHALQTKLSQPNLIQQHFPATSVRELTTYAFTKTFLSSDQLIEPFEFELTPAQNNDNHPTMTAWVTKLLTTTLSNKLSPAFINKFVATVQNLTFIQYNFDIGVVMLNVEPTFAEEFKQQLTLPWLDKIKVNTLAKIDELREYQTRYDGLIILTSILSYSELNQDDAFNNNPNIAIIPITNQDLVTLPSKIYQSAEQIRLHNFAATLNNLIVKNDS